jgi:predicted O-methyltransferase YrrM
MTVSIASEIPNIYDKLDIPARLTSLSKVQAEFIYLFLKENGIKKTLEIGFCYGCSAAHIIAATRSVHYVVDPWQKEVWNNQGKKNLKTLKLNRYLKLLPEQSHSALPKLLDKRKKFDFAFIDGDHKFDTVMIDFYYVDLLLNVGGYILLDDVELIGIKRVIDWITTNRLDYTRITLPPNPINGDPDNSYDRLALFQKTKVWEREWNHFNDF